MPKTLPNAFPRIPMSSPPNSCAEYRLQACWDYTTPSPGLERVSGYGLLPHCRTARSERRHSITGIELPTRGCMTLAADLWQPKADPGESAIRTLKQFA